MQVSLEGASQFGKNKRRKIIRDVDSRIIWGFNLVVLPPLAQIQEVTTDDLQMLPSAVTQAA